MIETDTFYRVIPAAHHDPFEAWRVAKVGAAIVLGETEENDMYGFDTLEQFQEYLRLNQYRMEWKK